MSAVSDSTENQTTTYEQLKLAFGPGAAGANRPERALWREFLTFAGVEGMTRLVAWELSSFTDAHGAAHVRLRTVAESAGMCLRSAKQAVATLKALAARGETPRCTESGEAPA